MSKTFLRPKVSSTKVTDWVDPSFDDFSETTGISITATSLGVNNSSHRRKNVPSRLESSRFLARKREEPSSSEKIYGLENSKEYLSENEPWVDKYKPETQHELAVHKKKIEEVETWLKAKVLEGQPKQGGSILLITGPPGCGKTTTIKILSKEHGIQVQEWINPILPDFQKDDFKEILNPESSFHVFPYQSQIAVFKEFLLRATKYNKLQMLGDELRTDKRIILVEDLPNQFYRNSHTLHEILRKYVHTGRCPLIFIISDSLSGDNNQRLLFPKEIQEECAIANISFNPVAPTIMMKFLNRIVTMEANKRDTAREGTQAGGVGEGEAGFPPRREPDAGLDPRTPGSRPELKNGGNIIIPDKSSLELLCQGCSGDIRSAINSLQFSSSKGASLTELDSPQLPSHLSEYERDTLLVQPEEVVEMSHMPGELFNLYLHQNYIDFFVEVDDLVRASDFLSFADTLSGDWNTRSLLRQYSTSIATRGVIHSNKARGFAHCQGGGSSFRPLHKPQWFLINKKYRENCLAAKALFSDFCLPALCLQTQLLPYLTLLTIPMRNPAQISFIQDIGRLPLKRHFGRLKMEALTDREPGLIDPDSGDEALLNGGQPAEEALGEPTQTAEPETCCLPLSQNSGSELPASQPQPFSAQGDMEEEELVIEDYESDGT
ncbi:cell cycle checkpoint protein RAD17 isoform X4 [Mirounga angustirostris]|uniref:cell cycle checkpoint protein RAD17 isoform X4 n=1 Tax=Mirounga angustirostris TaxID=9716 RepID=UPI00313BE151